LQLTTQIVNMNANHARSHLKTIEYSWANLEKKFIAS